MERNRGTYSSSSRVALTITQGITNDNGEAVRNKKKNSISISKFRSFSNAIEFKKKADDRIAQHSQLLQRNKKVHLLSS